MHINYASRNLTWTEPMQDWVTQKIAEPLARLLKTGKFDLSLYWEPARGEQSWDEGKKYEMWTILQTYDGRGNRIIRRLGNDFCDLTEDVGQSLREAL